MKEGSRRSVFSAHHGDLLANVVILAYAETVSIEGLRNIMDCGHGTIFRPENASGVLQIVNLPHYLPLGIR